jgi:hypothetical protein
MLNSVRSIRQNLLFYFIFPFRIPSHSSLVPARQGTVGLPKIEVIAYWRTPLKITLGLVGELQLNLHALKNSLGEWGLLATT